jgi:transposase-like protein
MADEHGFSEKELNAILDRLVKGKAPEEIMGQGGLVKDLTRRLVERALEGEMTDHLGYEKHAQEGRNGGNSRNGKTDKRVKTDSAEFGIEVPRDRDGSFDPQMVAKGQRRLPGFDEKVIALYARGMTTREIQGHLKELYHVDVSPTLISAVTDAVMEDVRAWQARALEPVYPIVYLDAIHVKLRTGGHDAQLRKVTMSRGAFPTPDSVRKVLYLAISKASERWTRPIPDWTAALNHLSIVFEGRIPV